MLRPGFNPWVGKIPWRREWQPTPVFLPGKSYGQRSLADYSLWGHKELQILEHEHDPSLTLSPFTYPLDLPVCKCFLIQLRAVPV